jgi:alkylation response protein AidB-like acyl-CoA dehydrogenase
MPVQFTDAEQELQQRVREFSDEHVAPHTTEYAKNPRWPWEIFEEAAEADLIGLPYGEEHGGQDASLVEECILSEEWTRADSNIGMALHGSMTGCLVLDKYGTADQKERWLEPVLRGEAINSIGLTEPDTGSDMSAVTTTAEKDGDDYVINGEKKWIANGVDGNCTATLCVTDPDAEPRYRGLSLIAVPPETEGYSARDLDKLGLDAAQHAYIEYDDVRVPQENLLGEEEGQGFYQALSWINPGRVTIGAAHLGMAEGAFDRALAYAKERQQGGQPIGDYQGLRWMLADMRTKIQVARSHVYDAARLVDRAEAGEDVDYNPTEQASIAKLYGTEIAIDVAEKAVQIFGGQGYEVEYDVEHYYRDAKAGTIYEGTSEIQRNTIGKALFDEL